MVTGSGRKKRKLDEVRSVFDEFLRKHELPVDAKDDFLKLKEQMETFISPDESPDDALKIKKSDEEGTSTKGTLGLGELVCTIEKLKFLSPRGKLRLHIYEEALVLQATNKGKDAEMFSIPHENIKDMMLLEDQKCSYICIALDDPLRYGKRKVGVILIAIDPDKDTSVSLERPVGDLKSPVSGNKVLVVKHILEAATEDIFTEPDENIFQACDRSFHVRCCIGAREGCLYPLACGLLFITAPVKFFARKSILEIAADLGIGRRTFDIGVYTEDSEKPFIFSMVPRDEQNSLTDYRRYMKIGIRKTDEEEESEEEEEADDESGSEFDIGEEMEISKNSMARDHVDLAKEGCADYSTVMDKNMLEIGAKVKREVPIIVQSTDEEEKQSTDDDTE